MAKNYFKPHKADRENARRARKEAKAERLAARRAARLQGVEIDSLPTDIQGLARTLANGEARQPRVLASTARIVGEIR